VTETRQWLLNGHPRGRPINDDDLKLVTTTLPEPGPGQMLLKTHYLGFDPAQKGWMENIADYVAPMAIGDVMRGSGITEVVASNGGKFPVGTMPAGIDTPMVQSLGGKLAALGAAAPVHDNATAMNRLGEPVDVANLVLFLASDESRFINGQSHVIDDGASVIAGSTVPRTDR
jgi:hypothetical protein